MPSSPLPPLAPSPPRLTRTTATTLQAVSNRNSDNIIDDEENTNEHLMQPLIQSAHASGNHENKSINNESASRPVLKTQLSSLSAKSSSTPPPPTPATAATLPQRNDLHLSRRDQEWQTSRSISRRNHFPSSPPSHSPSSHANSLQQGSGTSPHGTRITLRQVQDHSPYETLAETYIQDALDEILAEAGRTSRNNATDPVAPSSPANAAASSILANVPLDVSIQSFRVNNLDTTTTAGTIPARTDSTTGTTSTKAVATTAATVDATTESKSSLSPPKVIKTTASTTARTEKTNTTRTTKATKTTKTTLHKKQVSTADSLYQLTIDLETLNSTAAAANVPRDNPNKNPLMTHGNEDSNNNKGTSTNSSNSGSDENTFMKNAATIMKTEMAIFRKTQKNGLLSSSAAGARGDNDDASKEPSRRQSSSFPPKSHQQEDGLSYSNKSLRFTTSKSMNSTKEGKQVDGMVEAEIAQEIDCGVNLEEGEETSSNAEGSENDNNDHQPSTTMSLGNPLKTAKNQALDEYKDFEDWLRLQRSSVWTHIQVVLFVFMVPATGIAAILFYYAGNPPCSRQKCTFGSTPDTPSTPADVIAAVMEELNSTTTAMYDMTTIDDVSSEAVSTMSIQYMLFGAMHKASVSWWLLFLFCRQAVTFTLARGTNTLLIDYFALQSQWCVRIFGPFVTLLIVSSKGWPCILFFWSVYDLILLYGDNDFARHWLFYQNAIGLFNADNPSGGITMSARYLQIIILAIVVSAVVAIKRFYFGLAQGRRSYIRYSEELARVMKRTLMICKVAKLSREIETSKLRFENLSLKVASYDSEEIDEMITATSARPSQESSERHLLLGFDARAKKARLVELLGAWEEPEAKSEVDENPDIAEVLQFRHALSYLMSSVTFGPSFGPSSTREECVDSAEAVYNRLLQSTPGRDVLIFDVIAMLAITEEGELDEAILVALIKLFRPDRDGILTVLDFAKSVDIVFKEIRLLRASVVNSSKLDKAFESFFNIFFCILLLIICLGVVGVNLDALFVAVGSFLISVAFMVRISCSHFVEGLLLILVRRPYDIGDRIHISDPNTDTQSTGSPGWIVRDIDLYTTTVMLGATNEVATYSNGALAASRIINGARSHKAVMNFHLKFPIYTSYKKLQIFKSAMERFVKARPREWGALLAFRCTRVEADLGFVEYIVLAQHRESWQTLGALLQSRAELSSFALELSKQMNMRYVSPPKPIDLMLNPGGESLGAGGAVERDRQSVAMQGGSIGQVAQNVAAMFGTTLTP